MKKTNFYKNFDWENAKNLLKSAIKEDVGDSDITSDILIPDKKVSKAVLLLKDDAVIAGTEIFKYVFNLLNKNVSVFFLISDGEYVFKNRIIALISGPTKEILKGERVALNILQRMSGIATQVYKMNKRLNNSFTKILDTRKTTPNFRIFEKLAVKIGGGVNHRSGLYDMILIKDNHIAANGGIKKTLEILKRKKIRKSVKIEIEVRNIEELKTVIKYGKDVIDIIMLDNFTIPMIKEAVNLIKKEFKVEVSGSINYNNIQRYSKIKNVDYISSGSITHSVNSADISLNFIT